METALEHPPTHSTPLHSQTPPNEPSPPPATNSESNPFAFVFIQRQSLLRIDHPQPYLFLLFPTLSPNPAPLSPILNFNPSPVPNSIYPRAKLLATCFGGALIHIHRIIRTTKPPDQITRFQDCKTARRQTDDKKEARLLGPVSPT